MPVKPLIKKPSKMRRRIIRWGVETLKEASHVPADREKAIQEARHTLNRLITDGKIPKNAQDKISVFLRKAILTPKDARRLDIARQAMKRYVKRENIAEEPLRTHLINLASKNTLERNQAIEFLRQVNDPRIIEPVCRVGLRDPMEYFRADCCLILGFIGDPVAFQPLATRLTHDPSHTVRLDAAQAIGHLKFKNAQQRQAAAKPLLEVLKTEKDPGVIESLAHGLNRLGIKEEAQKIIEERLKAAKTSPAKNPFKHALKVLERPYE